MKKVLVFVVVGVIALFLALVLIGSKTKVVKFFDNIDGVPIGI